MLIDLKMLTTKYDVKYDGLLHVGAHHGEEATVYKELGIKPVYWVEADESSIAKLKRNIKWHHENYVVQAAVSDTVGEVNFNRANNGESSSLLEFGTHTKEHPEVVFTESYTVTTTTIDDLWDDGLIGTANFINLDIQGAELMALKGGESFLTQVDYVYAEVNIKELYKGGAMLGQLDSWLGQRGFIREETSMTIHGWGDAFFCRKARA